jgi:WhiB family redox-sensing transcriptional regulator
MLVNDWWRAAACRDAEPELFFPISATRASKATVRRAKRICAACPVSSDCLSYALAHRQEQGIWGGLTDEERQLRRRKLAGAAGKAKPAMTVQPPPGMPEAMARR